MKIDHYSIVTTINQGPRLGGLEIVQSLLFLHEVSASHDLEPCFSTCHLGSLSIALDDDYLSIMKNVLIFVSVIVSLNQLCFVRVKASITIQTFPSSVLLFNGIIMLDDITLSRTIDFYIYSNINWHVCKFVVGRTKGKKIISQNWKLILNYCDHTDF